MVKAEILFDLLFAERR